MNLLIPICVLVLILITGEINSLPAGNYKEMLRVVNTNKICANYENVAENQLDFIEVSANDSSIIT
jgi:hypothetical protein